MEYTPVNMQAIRKGTENYYDTTIGPYDIWAIQYGYEDFGAKSPLAERVQLKNIARIGNEQGLAFMTDENVTGIDPRIQRWDLSSDPNEYSKTVMYVAKDVRTYAIQNLPAFNSSFARRTSMILGSLNRLFGEGRKLSQFVGGMAMNRNFQGDVNQQPVLRPIDPDVQRDAARTIAKEVFTPSNFALSYNVLVNLGQDNSDPSNARWTAPLRQSLGTQMSMIVSMLMSVSTLNQIAENEFKQRSFANKYTMSEHYSIVTGAIYSEIGSDQPIDPIRRDLQQFTLRALLSQAGTQSGPLNTDAVLVANQTLNVLQEQIGSQLKSHSKLDQMTVMHLKDMKERIERFKDREQIAP
jgi:hypothetical protein